MAEPGQLTFVELQGILATLQVPDHRFLAAAGLGPFADKYVAYPATFGPRRLCVLVGRSLKIADAKRVSAEAAGMYVIVLERAGKGWRRVWPSSGTMDDPLTP